MEIERGISKTPMTLPTLHILFSMSAAVDLREALRQAGRDDEVIALPDDLSFGPIAPPDSAARSAWVERELGYEWDDVGPDCEAFWYAGFLEYVWRLGDLPSEVVDMTDVQVTNQRKDGSPLPPQLALSLALVRADRILDHGLLERAEPLSPAMRDDHRAAWQRLRAENAPLRVLTADKQLVSAPIDFFDEDLLAAATERWRKAALVIATLFDKFWDDHLLQTGDLVPASRLRALAEAGRLESRGDLLQIRYSEVRLPASQEQTIG